MVILGLTGSIGMGKSTAAGALRRLGVPVYDADGVIHRLIGRAAPRCRWSTSVRGRGDRRRREPPRAGRHGVRRSGSTAAARGDPASAGAPRPAWIPAAAARRRVRLVVLDIPLLFETRGERRCDAVALLSAPRAIQEARVLARPGMTPEKLAGIRKRQMPDAQKRRRADFIVPTGLSKRELLRRLGAIVARMRAKRGRHWRPGAAGN